MTSFQIPSIYIQNVLLHVFLTDQTSFIQTGTKGKAGCLRQKGLRALDFWELEGTSTGIPLQHSSLEGVCFHFLYLLEGLHSFWSEYLLYEIASGHKGFVHAGEGRSAYLQTEGLSMELPGLFFWTNYYWLTSWRMKSLLLSIPRRHLPVPHQHLPSQLHPRRLEGFWLGFPSFRC